MPKPNTTVDTPVAELLNTNGDSSILLLCEHASNRIPPELLSLWLQASIAAIPGSGDQ